MSSKSRHVVVTTEHKGVFGGVLVQEDTEARTAILTDAQMAVYWAADVHGVLGLAANGPSESCRITAAVPQVTLTGTTAVIDMSEKAAEAWKSAPWT